MKYLCLIYTNMEHTEANPAGEPKRRQDAVTIRVRNGRLSAVEGSGAAGGHLQDVVLIRARDLNDAIRVASQMPEARVGGIEVRPVDDPE